ncbi:hypothetical protein [Cellulomonas hominis]
MKFDGATVTETARRLRTLSAQLPCTGGLDLSGCRSGQVIGAGGTMAWSLVDHLMAAGADLSALSAGAGGVDQVLAGADRSLATGSLMMRAV